MCNLLSSEFWAFRVYALSALLNFVPKIPTVHKSFVRKCFPSKIQPMMQSRLRKTIICEKQNLAKFEQELKPSRKGILIRENTTNIFSIRNSAVIPFREAIVIFPPGNESLEDIKCRLCPESDNNEAGPTVQLVHNAKLLHEGGCKLVLQQLQL
jgi:hypothetical protein